MSLFRNNKNKSNKEKKDQTFHNSKSDKSQSNDVAKENNNAEGKTTKILNSDNADKSSGLTNNEKKLTSSFEDNIEKISNIFDGDDTVVRRRFQNKHGLKFHIFYSDGMVSSIILDQHIMYPLQYCEVKKGKDSINELMETVITISEAKVVDNFAEIIQAISYGDTVLLVEGQDKAIVLNSKSFFMRSVQEPATEFALEGPREGFTEVLMANLSMVKRRLRTGNLKMKYYSLGERSHTQVCVCYLDGIVNENVLKNFTQRLEAIKIDGVLDSNYIAEITRTNKHSIFRESGVTEKPDTVAAKLLEGRVALFVDGSPAVITVPYLFIENFQTSDDYYTNFYYGSIARILKLISFFMTIIIPPFYLALVAFHKEMLPTVFFVNIAVERAGVPFPVIVEMVLMLIVFDLLREAGLRMPSNVGSALSIVGALVIGQAAVQAKLIDSAVIIIVALSAITGLLSPRLTGPIIILRLAFIAAAGVFGMYGLVLALMALIIHLYNLNSYGVPQVQYFEEYKFQNYKDYAIRTSWSNMIKRPQITKDRIRMKIKNDKKKN